MAFSFIRKIIAPNTSGNITLENESDAAPIVAEESGFDLSQLSIEVIDNDSLLTPIQEEAAMLHASGQSIAAAKILHSELKKIAGLHQTEAWLMLFELLQQNNDKQLFDKVALLFVLEFEKTPPTWRQHSVKASSEAQNYYQFPAILSHSNIDKELLAFQAALQACSSLRIDMAKIKEIDTIAAAELLAVWQRSVKKGIRLQLLGNHEIETLSLIHISQRKTQSLISSVKLCALCVFCSLRFNPLIHLMIFLLSAYGVGPRAHALRP